MDKTKIIQIGILVKDIEETTRNWAEFLECEVPEIGCTERYEVSHATYQGQECNGRIYQSAFQFGNLELELISPVDDEPCYWKECLDRDGEGIHHIAFYTREIEKDIERLECRGYKVVQKGNWPAQPRDGAYAYVDTIQKLKCAVELLDFL